MTDPVLLLTTPAVFRAPRSCGQVNGVRLDDIFSLTSMKAKNDCKLEE